MKYGVCNWIFGDESLAETAARLAGFGYDGLELKGDLELYDPAAEVKAAAGYVSPYEDGDGVVDILRRWVEGEK